MNILFKYVVNCGNNTDILGAGAPWRGRDAVRSKIDDKNGNLFN